MQKQTVKLDTSLKNIASISKQTLQSVYGVVSLIDVKDLTKAKTIPNGYDDGIVVKKVANNISLTAHVCITDEKLEDDISLEIEKQLKYVLKKNLKIDVKKIDVVVHKQL